MSAAEKLDSTVIEAFKPYEHFSKVMLDAFVVVNKDGRVLKANQLLGQLLGKKTKQILKSESLDHDISFYIQDKRLTVLELIDQPGPSRVDEVRGAIPENENLNLIIGTYPFFDNAGQSLGAFILIRDVTAETALQFKYKDAKNQSITDPLTGLFTRGYFEDYLNLQLKTLYELPENSPQREMSLVMIDIDFFKKVNDVHGHQAGDYVLEQVSEVMRNAFRKTDVPCRYGGEEFLAILPSTDVIGAIHAAEKLRAVIEAEKIVFQGTHIPITVSLGVAQIKIGVETYAETMARADAALYESKRNGRNRVTKAEG